VPAFSVVVPTLEEEERVERTLRSARRALGDDAELIVVDGGSRDGTREAASGLARVLEAPPRRGLQLDAGARAAAGEILVFLHADTRLEPDSGEAIRTALARPDVAGGCFRFAVDPPSSPGSRYRLLEAAVRLRTRLFRTATGDQAIFTTRETYGRAGGYPDHPLFEDVAFVRRLRRLGRFVPIRARALTSRRRWERDGFWATVARHGLLRLAYGAGVSPERLAAWYGARSGPGARAAG
jgi:rSAM/selenodomain-associated transferase 2